MRELHGRVARQNPLVRAVVDEVIFNYIFLSSMGAKERAEALEELERKCQEEGYLYTSGTWEPTYSTVHIDCQRVGIDFLEKQAFSPSYDLAPFPSPLPPSLSSVSSGGDTQDIKRRRDSTLLIQ